MNTLTSTATKAVSNTKLAIAVCLLLAAGGTAWALLPSNVSKESYGYGFNLNQKVVKIVFERPEVVLDKGQKFIFKFRLYNSNNEAVGGYLKPFEATGGVIKYSGQGNDNQGFYYEAYYYAGQKSGDYRVQAKVQNPDGSNVTASAIIKIK